MLFPLLVSTCFIPSHTILLFFLSSFLQTSRGLIPGLLHLRFQTFPCGCRCKLTGFLQFHNALTFILVQRTFRTHIPSHNNCNNKSLEDSPQHLAARSSQTQLNMRLLAFLATIVAFFTFALAEEYGASSSSSVSVTTTVTLTLYHANSTTTKTAHSGIPTVSANATDTYAAPTFAATATGPCDNCIVNTGAANSQVANVAFTAFAGVAALAFSLL